MHVPNTSTVAGTQNRLKETQVCIFTSVRDLTWNFLQLKLITHAERLTAFAQVTWINTCDTCTISGAF